MCRCTGALRQADLYPGIDLRVRLVEGAAEYDVFVEPGASLDAVVVRCEGVTRAAPGRFRRPAAQDGRGHAATEGSQDVGGGRPRAGGLSRAVTDSSIPPFRLRGARADPGQRLFVDPGLEWSTLRGGTRTDSMVQRGLRPRGIRGRGTEQLGRLSRTEDAWDEVFGGGVHSPVSRTRTP